MIRKAVLQNHMAFNILTASQGNTCAIIQTSVWFIYHMNPLMGDVLGRYGLILKAHGLNLYFGNFHYIINSITYNLFVL